MIPLTEIFEHIRKQKKYQKHTLAEHLNLSMHQLNSVIRRGRIPTEMLYQWADFLEIDQNMPALIQYNSRYCWYHTLLEQQVPKSLADVLATLLEVRQQVDISRVREIILTLIIPHVYTNPYLVRNAIDEINANER